MKCFLRIFNIYKCFFICVCLLNTFRKTTGDECELPGGARGECVALPACLQYVTLLKESTTTELGLKLTRERRCGFEENNPKVCCPTVTEDPAVELRTNLTDPDYVELPEPGVCGQKSYSEFTRISGGRAVRSRRHVPWMALLAYNFTTPPTWECGGSIITTRHVLTAAHCIRESLFVVRIGELDLAKTKQVFDPIDFSIKKKIRHEQYTRYHNDIGILVLDETIPIYDPQFSEFIAPLCLPVTGLPYENKILRTFITGWGETEKNERPTNLLFAYLKILDQDTCKKVYKSIATTIDERVFCAGDSNNKRDACHGDSGGPLVGDCFVPGYGSVLHYQVGLVSYGFQCSEKRYTGVYTNITTFMPWILEKVTGKSRPRQ